MYKQAYMSSIRYSRPRPTDQMYQPPPGFQIMQQSEVSSDLGRIAQKFLQKALEEKWSMPSETFFSIDGKQYAAKFQIHGPNASNPVKHPGIGLYERSGVYSGTNTKTRSSAGSNLSNEFFVKLNAMCQRLGINPKDMLTTMQLESGLNPHAINPKFPERGLTQIYNLKGVGWNGTKDEFAALSAEDQLPYIERYFEQNLKYKPKSATQFYIVNLLPAYANSPGVINEDPNTVLIDKANDNNPKTRNFYSANRWLDTDNDGKITYGDLEKIINRKQKEITPVFARLDNVIGGRYYSEPEKQDNGSFVSQILTVIKEIINKYANNSSAPYLIEINGINKVYKFEYARILDQILTKKFNSKITLLYNSKNIALKCETSLQLSQLDDICLYASQIFKEATSKFGSIMIYTAVKEYKKSNLEEMDLKTAELNYRMFRLQLYGVKNG